MREHLVVHQFDPAEQIAGGVHGFLVDLVRYAPPDHSFLFVGVDSTGSRKLGVWYEVTIAGRPARFLAVARLSAGRPRRRVPHTLRLVGGLLARRVHIGDAILHAHRVEVGAALALAYPRSPLVQFVHTDATKLARHRVESFWRFLPRGQLALERRAVKRADRTIVFSQAAAARLATVSSNVSAYTNWFDDAVFFTDGRADEASPTVGWVGRFEGSKDPFLALDVFARLARSDSRFSGWLAGAGTLESALRDRLDGLGLLNRVALLGTLSPDQLAERLRATRVLLVTSLWEGEPRAVLEALACGTAVVSTDVGGMRRLLVEGTTGYVAQSRTADELATLATAASELSDPARIAASVSQLRARIVVPRLLDEMGSLQ